MILAFILICVALALWYFAPKGIAVHAAISEGVELPAPRFPLAAFFRDSSGRSIDWETHLPARVRGNSCKDYGIENGDIVIVRILDSESRSSLKEGDLVVINSAVADESTGVETHPLRFRKIRTIEKSDSGTTMDFFEAPKKPVKKQSISSVHSIVEFMPPRS